MTYSIDRIENGKLFKLHPDIRSRDEAKKILSCIANENMKQGNIVMPRPTLESPCSVVINGGKTVYLIGE